MADCQSDTTPIARKNHTCQECGRVIPKGIKHHLQRGVQDGEWYSWRVHSDCAALYWALNADYCSWVDEYLPISEFDAETISAFRGAFPHAVCRQELARDLSDIRWEKHLKELEISP